MTKLTKSNLDFRNPPKVKDNPSKQLTHRPTMTAHTGAKPGDPKYGTVDQVRTADEVKAELDHTNERIANFEKPIDDPRRFSNKQDRELDQGWKEVSIRALERKRDALINELASFYSSQEYESKPMSRQLTNLMKAMRSLQVQIKELPRLWGDERSTLAVARAERHLEELLKLTQDLSKTHQPWGDAEVEDEIADQAAKLYAEWQRSKET